MDRGRIISLAPVNGNRAALGRRTVPQETGSRLCWLSVRRGMWFNPLSTGTKRGCQIELACQVLLTLLNRDRLPALLGAVPAPPRPHRPRSARPGGAFLCPVVGRGLGPPYFKRFLNVFCANWPLAAHFLGSQGAAVVEWRRSFHRNRTNPAFSLSRTIVLWRRVLKKSSRRLACTSLRWSAQLRRHCQSPLTRRYLWRLWTYG